MAEPTDGAPRGGGRSDATRESKPADRNDGSRDAARIERDRQAANNFRQMTQPERLQDRRMNAGAKAVAALDAAIDRKYGPSTAQAERMKKAARESVAQTLERGQQVRAPRLREAERDRGTSTAPRQAAERDNRDRDRQNADRDR
jgi:hypothetical protein